MQIESIHHTGAASGLQPEELANHPNVTEKEKIKELCRQFEAVLLRQILKDAQKTVIKSDLTTESAGGDIYKDMITTQLAESISLSRSFGFAQSLEEQLTRQILTQPVEPSDAK